MTTDPDRPIRKADPAFLDPTVEKYQSISRFVHNKLKYFKIGAETDPNHPIGKAVSAFLKRKAGDTDPVILVEHISRWVRYFGVN